jgi:hypothetical protein
VDEEELDPTPEELMATMTIEAAEGDMDVDEVALLNPDEE